MGGSHFYSICKRKKNVFLFYVSLLPLYWVLFLTINHNSVQKTVESFIVFPVPLQTNQPPVCT